MGDVFRSGTGPVPERLAVAWGRIAVVPLFTNPVIRVPPEPSCPPGPGSDAHTAWALTLAADSDDDGPALVYADWLADRADPAADVWRAVLLGTDAPADALGDPET